MESGSTTLTALLLLSLAAGGFGYSLGWQRAQLTASQEFDHRLSVLNGERFRALTQSTGGEPDSLTLAAAQRSPDQDRSRGQ